MSNTVKVIMSDVLSKEQIAKIRALRSLDPGKVESFDRVALCDSHEALRAEVARLRVVLDELCGMFVCEPSALVTLIRLTAEREALLAWLSSVAGECHQDALDAEDEPMCALYRGGEHAYRNVAAKLAGAPHAPTPETP